MSENTVSTNVDSEKADKYSKDLEEGAYVCNNILGEFIFGKEKLEISVDSSLAAQKQIVTGESIKENGEMDIKVTSLPIKEFNEYKDKLKKKQVAQEKIMREKADNGLEEK